MQSRQNYDRELSELSDQVMILGSMVDRALDRAIETLKRLNMVEARSIIEDDTVINRKRYEIEAKVEAIVARQQPIAADLRLVLATLGVVQELERMGDHAAGIAKIVLMHGDEPLLKPLIDLPRMADKARDMLQRSLHAFADQDVKAAKAIALEDDEVDALYDQVYRELLVLMFSDPRRITRATYLLWAAHNIERIADRTTNICERAVFAATGEFEEFNTTRY